MITFTEQRNSDFTRWAGNGTLTTWNVGYFPDGESTPTGGAVVIESPTEAILFFVFVDPPGQPGVALRIVWACRQKWPGIQFTKRIRKQEPTS